MLFPCKINAYDAQNRRFVGGSLQKENERVYFKKESDQPYEDVNLYISNGFIDMHVHFNDGYGIFGMHPSKFGHCWGVHVLSDCGSCGIDNFDAFCKYVLPSFKGVTIPRMWLHVNRFGLPSNHEAIDFSTLVPKETAELAKAHPELIVGIKVRLNCDIPEKDCLVPLDRALEAAELAGLPLMVHISQGPPLCKDILPRLRKGDVVTHIYNGKYGSPWEEDGAPTKELRDAYERGVYFDLAHGYSSFNFETCRKAVAHGFSDVSISTDMHKRCFLGPPFTYADVMTKAHSCGIPFEQIIYGCTAKPAKMLGMTDWATMENMQQHATIFSYDDNTGKKEFYDAFQHTDIPEKLFVPRAIITDGRFEEI